MKDDINKVIDELQESVRFFIEVKARVTIDLPQYRGFYDTIQRFIGQHKLENTAEWKELDRWLIRTSREYVTQQEAVAIHRALEGLHGRGLPLSIAGDGHVRAGDCGLRDSGDAGGVRAARVAEDGVEGHRETGRSRRALRQGVLVASHAYRALLDSLGYRTPAQFRAEWDRRAA